MSECRAFHMFDLDGTLVDTFALTVEAYRQAGIDFTPDMWGRSAKDWNCPAEAHAKKQKVFTELLLVNKLPDAWATPIWQQLDYADRTILTGASFPTYKSVITNREDLFGHDGLLHRFNCSLDGKVRHILHELKFHSVVYYEDQPHIAEDIYQLVKAGRVENGNFFSIVTPKSRPLGASLCEQ